MTVRIKESDLRPELRLTETRHLMMASMDMMLGRVRLIYEFRKRGVPSMTMIDIIANLHIFIFRNTGGTRAQTLVDGMRVPRRTVRDSLARLEAGGFIVREQGCYFPTIKAGKICEDTLDERILEFSRITDAMIAYRSAVRRLTP